MAWFKPKCAHEWRDIGQMVLAFGMRPYPDPRMKEICIKCLRARPVARDEGGRK